MSLVKKESVFSNRSGNDIDEVCFYCHDPIEEGEAIGGVGYL